MDTLTKTQRSYCMSQIRSSGSKLEQSVEKILQDLGFLFDRQRRDLPGTPDFAIPEVRVAIFVNGCFWHGHSCKRGKLPTSRKDFWEIKISATIHRDQVSRRKLRTLGWRTVTVWGCRLRSPEAVKRRLNRIVRDVAHEAVHSH